MNKKLIVIEGYLASGKSTFARLLSEELNIPYFIKDTLKIALCESINITTREEGSRFSVVTFDAMMYVTERLMEVGYPIIIEGNFVPFGIKKKDESSVIKALVKKYEYSTLTFKFKGDAAILYDRYIERENSPERGEANRDFEVISYEKFDNDCKALEPFNIGGEIIEIDTSDFNRVDFMKYIDKARMFEQMVI